MKEKPHFRKWDAGRTYPEEGKTRPAEIRICREEGKTSPSEIGVGRAENKPYPAEGKTRPAEIRICREEGKTHPEEAIPGHARVSGARTRFAALLLAALLVLTALLGAGCGPAPVSQDAGTAEGTSADGGASAETGAPADGSGDAQAGSPDVNAGTEDGTAAASEPAISEEEAVEIVLSRVPGAEKSEIVSFGRDYEDGRWEYDGKLIHDGIEYEFEIDAQNGNLLEWELDD